MPNLATWIRRKDAKWFRAIFGKHPEIKVWNALNRKVPLEKMDGLLLTGGSDISPEFLRQKVVDPSLLSKDMDPERDRWEFEAAQEALSRGLPILAICKGLQVFNVALGGTLKLDIKGTICPNSVIATFSHCAARTARRIVFAKSTAPITRRSNGWATIWKQKLGALTMASWSKFGCGNIHSASLCNIIRSAAAFIIRFSRISCRG